jgi:hypothetical protein
MRQIGVVLRVSSNGAPWSAGEEDEMRAWAALVVIGLVSNARVDTANSLETQTIEITLLKSANVPDSTVSEAQSQVAAIYAPLEIQLIWSDTIALEAVPGRQKVRRQRMTIVSHVEGEHRHDIIGFTVKGHDVACSTNRLGFTTEEAQLIVRGLRSID